MAASKADTLLTLTYDSTTSKVRVHSSALIHLTKLRIPIQRALREQDKPPYALTINLSGSIPASLPTISWTAADALEVARHLLRVFHSPQRAGARGLGIAQLLLAHHLDGAVLGLAPPYRAWLAACLRLHARDLDLRIRAGVPVAAADWELALHVAGRLRCRGLGVHVAASLVRSARVVMVVVAATPEEAEAPPRPAERCGGEVALRPTGEGVVTDGRVVGPGCVAGLVRVRETVLRWVAAAAAACVERYEWAARSERSEACRACAEVRLRALVGCLEDIGLRGAEELPGLSLWELERAMKKMAGGEELSPRVAPHVGTCEAEAHETPGSNLFAIEDACVEVWDGIQARIYEEIICAPFLESLFGS